MVYANHSNPHAHKLEDTASATGVNTDASGDVTLTFNGLRKIDSQEDVSVEASGGYVCNVQSVSGNSATVRIFEAPQGGTSSTSLVAVTSGTSVTDIHGRAFGQ